MVASLESRRDTLEAMLRDKTLELKWLCIQEAELTGILPPETPSTPDEWPPILSRRIDNHRINHLKGNVENRSFQRASQVSVPSVDGFHAYSSIRRVSKPEYQYSRYDLQSSELELNNIFKQINIDKAHAYRPVPNGTWNRNQWYRHSVSQVHHNPDGYEFANWPKQNPQHSRASASNLTNHLYATLATDSYSKSQYDSLNREQRLPRGSNGRTSFSEAHRNPVSPLPNPVDLRTFAPCTGYASSTLPVAATRHRSLSVSSPIKLDTRNTTLESHQLYGSNNGAKHLSCQSLDLYSIPEKGSRQFRCNSLGRKRREKEWRETSLDTSDSKQRQIPPFSLRTPNIPESASFQRLLSRHRTQSLNSYPSQSPPDFTPPSPRHRDNKSPQELALQMESNVPLESPKNHMVVEVGKWKPYRESSKPFEMSDFYKYSTKFKKNKE